jgi:hypothetical protein
MSGTFNVTMRTPMGPTSGVLTLADESGTLSGSIRTMGSTSYFRNGKADGNSFEFSGILNAGFFNFRYTVRGTVDGDVLKAVAITDSGTFQISGTRRTT